MLVLPLGAAVSPQLPRPSTPAPKRASVAGLQAPRAQMPGEYGPMEWVAQDRMNPGLWEKLGEVENWVSAAAKCPTLFEA